MRRLQVNSLYAFNISLQHTFSKAPYSFSTEMSGLISVPNSLGYFLASILGGRWTDRIMAREAQKSGRCGETGKPMSRPQAHAKECLDCRKPLPGSADLVWMDS